VLGPRVPETLGGAGHTFQVWTAGRSIS
jgi:hypothetical protein